MMPQQTFFPAVPADVAAVFGKHDLQLMGIAEARNDEAAEIRYREWIQDGNHGDMAWLKRHASLKYHPAAILEGCRSILFAALSYYQAVDARSDTGRVAMYAWGRDYHKVLGNRLRKVARDLREIYPSQHFKGYTDATPLDERHYAMSGGVGFTGRNTLLIHSGLGSWFVVGEVLSTYEWPATILEDPRHGACPQACRKCLDICPTGALTAPGQMDARRCIAYLTIESKGGIPLEFREKLGHWIFGCDLCQEVCPFQLRKVRTEEKDFLKHRAGPYIHPHEILHMNTNAFENRFAGTPIMRTGLWRMQRNACIVAGNMQDENSVPALETVCQGKDPVLAEHAAWALGRM